MVVDWPGVGGGAGGDYYGPAGRFGYTGAPVRVETSPTAHEPEAQRRLWKLSEQLSGVAYSLPTPAVA